MRAVMPLVNFLCVLSTLAFVFFGLATLDAWRFECVTLAGVARPSFLIVPWAISESLVGWLVVRVGEIGDVFGGSFWVVEEKIKVRDRSGLAG